MKYLWKSTKMRKDRWLVGNGEINGKITDGERAEAREICRLQPMGYAIVISRFLSFFDCSVTIFLIQ